MLLYKKLLLMTFGTTLLHFIMVWTYHGDFSTQITPKTQIGYVCMTGPENLKKWPIQLGRVFILTDISHRSSLTP